MYILEIQVTGKVRYNYSSYTQIITDWEPRKIKYPRCLSHEIIGVIYMETCFSMQWCVCNQHLAAMLVSKMAVPS